MTENIFVNQIGYKPIGKKTVWAKGLEKLAPSDRVFEIKDKDGNTAYKGIFNRSVKDRLCEEEIFSGDFSDFTQSGEFKICCSEYESYSFKIEDKPFDSLYFSILNYFYLSRCGEKIEDKVFGHEACHTSLAEIYGENSEKKVPVKGGWHDAGDYGRYVVAGTKTCMDLLLAYEVSGNLFTKFDILSEVRFELEWLLQMQRDDGGVYHKISCYKFCAFIMPEQEKDRIVLAPVSTAATADFAGCAAYAAKFYEKSDSDFARKLIEAAKKAQEYLDCHEDEFYKNPPEITTGGYGDGNVIDERYFALCSLYAATEDKECLKKALEIRQKGLNRNKELADSKDPNLPPWMKTVFFESFGWGSVAGYGTEILIKNKQKLLKSGLSGFDMNEVEKSLEKSIVDAADRSLKTSESVSFGVGAERFNWGSNGHLSDVAHILLLAHDITGEERYFNAAKAQFDYILGCNPLNLCYITGFGSKSPVKPHHRPTGALKAVMPGMLAGGAAEGLFDQDAKKYLVGKAPLYCYLDMVGSYSTNEVAIYWNSPFVYITAKLGMLS